MNDIISARLKSLNRNVIIHDSWDILSHGSWVKCSMGHMGRELFRVTHLKLSSKGILIITGVRSHHIKFYGELTILNLHADFFSCRLWAL